MLQQTAQAAAPLATESLSIELPATRLLPGRAPDTVAALATALGWSRAALLCSRRFAQSAAAGAILAALPPGSRVFDVVEPHAPTGRVEEAAAQVAAYRPDVLVSLGGGSAHDLTKGVAVLLGLGGRLLDHCLTYQPPDDLRHRPLPGPKLPIVTIPTTLAGSEANGAAGFTPPDQARKRVLADPSLTPCAVLVDGALLRSTPSEITYGSAMNALNHCIEGLASRRSNLLAQALLSTALVELAGASDSLVDAPDTQWERLGLASALAGIGLTGSWLGLAHAMGHVIGARYRVPHGHCHAVLAGAVVRFNAPVAAPHHAEAARLLGLDPSSAALADWLDSRAAGWQLPTRLQQLGVTRDALPELADQAWHDHDSYYNARRVTSPEQILQLLQSVY